MIAALHIAGRSLQQAEARLEAATGRVVAGRQAPVRAVVDQRVALRDAEAQAGVVRTADDMAGVFLDLFA